jgi:hypothetical protein
MGEVERHAAAELRVRNALQHIERAQNELARACAELSSIRGAMPMWRKISRLHDVVKAAWYAINDKDRGRWQLDREPGVLEALPAAADDE